MNGKLVLPEGVTRTTPRLDVEVDGPELLAALESYMRGYVVLPAAEQYLILALYTIHTWCYEGARATPYIYIHSPTPGSGKSLLLEVLGTLVRNPIHTSSITPSALFRVVEDQSPTLMIDEVDAVFAGRSNEALRGVINSGYRRGAHVWRMAGGEPKPFSTFCPKVLAGIYNLHLPDTIRDRSLPIVMRRRRDDDPAVKSFYVEDARPEGGAIVDLIDAWVARHGRELDPRERALGPMEGVGNRQWEIAAPLVAIASELGVEQSAREAVRFLYESVEGQEASDASIFEDVIRAFGDRDKIFTEELLLELGGDYTARRLSDELAMAGVRPVNVRRGNVVKKGYRRADFAAALGEFDRSGVAA